MLQRGAVSLMWPTLYADTPKLTFGKCIQRLTKHKEKYGKYVDTVMTRSLLARLPLLYHSIKLHPAAVAAADRDASDVDCVTLR